MESITVEAVRWVLAEGLALLDDVDDHDPLGAVSRLRGQGLTREQAAAVLDLAAGTRSALASGQPAGTIWTRLAAEQASHPEVARWRAARFAGRDVVDLTAGCGGDAIALATTARTVRAVEQDPVRGLLLRHNLPAACDVAVGDGRDGPVDAEVWWADPSRRDATGRRIKRLRDIRPALAELQQAADGRAGGVAVSPGIDLSDPDLPAPTDAELEFVQVGRDLVEAVLWTGELRGRAGEEPAGRSATLLPAGHHISRARPGERLGVRELGPYLLEAEPALVRARLHETVGREYGAAPLAVRRALLTCASAVASPWFRCWQVEAVTPARPKSVRAALQELDEAPLEIALHGFDGDVQDWLRRLDARTGPNGRRLHLIRLDGSSVAVLSREVPRRSTGAAGT